MNILDSVRAYFGSLDRRRRFYRTERLVRSLPPEVLKDIGWPGSGDGIDSPRRVH